MDKNYFISIYLDTRRANRYAKYPVKLRVFTSCPRKQKLYSTAFNFTESEFQSIWETTKPREKYKDIRLQLQGIEAKAYEAAEKLNHFTFEAFESVLFDAKPTREKDLSYYYNIAIDNYKKNSKIGTASNYDLSLKSLIIFNNNKPLQFYDITPQWLNDYEKYMVEVKEKSKTTVGFYLRPLRAVFNSAIDNKAISPDVYPFGKRKYTIPAPKGVKKALSKEQLKVLFEGQPLTPEQEKAKAFWFFSYFCNGMNIKDIANLRFKNFSGDTFTFMRAKTANTNKQQAPATVFLNDYTLSVIEKYGNKDKSQDNYVFPIFEPKASPEGKHRAINNFIRYINQHMGNYAESLGITEKISTYWARHSFATNAIRSGASMEMISELLTHTSLKTTKGYFAGFESDAKRELAKKLMEF